MKKVNRKSLIIALVLLSAFVGWTIAVKFIDIQPIGPDSSLVGFATINDWFNNFIGVNITLYTITDWFSLIPIAIVVYFAILGLVQFVQRKSILKVDYSIISLGVFYCVVMAVFLLFEIFVINYRPVLIEGHLEASYPSSTTLLVICIMSTAVMQFNNRIGNKILKSIISAACIAFTIFMVVGRIVSGVHWITDIIGGVILSSGLVILYSSFNRPKK